MTTIPKELEDVDVPDLNPAIDDLERQYVQQRVDECTTWLQSATEPTALLAKHGGRLNLEVTASVLNFYFFDANS